MFDGKSKSNLTWFFTSDARNKSVRRALIGLLQGDPRAVVDQAHRKCHQALWPRPGEAAFDAAALRRALGSVRLPAATEERYHIVQPAPDGPARLDVFFDVDEAAALARMILTLAVAGDAPADVMEAVWSREADCDFMRGDDSVAGRMRYCRMLDLQGRADKALEGFERIAAQLGRPAQSADEAAMYCRMGQMLFNGEGCARDERAAQAYDRLGCLDEYPRSWYQLAQHSSGAQAREALERAARLGYGPAIRQLGEAWYTGSARLACARSLEAARRWFQRGMTLPGADGAHCAFMAGQIHEALNERDAALNAYRAAQAGGSAEAAERLARLDWVIAPEREAPEKPAAGEARCCLINGAEGCNRLFLEGLQGRWEVTVCADAAADALPEGAVLRRCAPEAALREMAKLMFWGGAARFPELTIALLSPDRQQNLTQAVALLGELRRLAEGLGERRWDLVDAVRLYVLAANDDAAPLLDAAFAGMGGLYFQLRLCDPALDAADRLLSAAPLFLPRLGAAADAPVRLKIVGCGDAAMAVLRRALALMLPEAAAFTVDVYGDGAEAMGRRLMQLCPGLRGREGARFGAPPRFHPCPPEEALLDAMDGPEGLADGNYFVVAAGSDALNLRLGMLLRGELMKRGLEAERPPFIAVHTAHPVAAWLGGTLPAGAQGQAQRGPQGAQAQWHSHYGLFPFGALDMYAPQALESDVLERRARQAHMLFIGLPNTPDARHTAMGGYYRQQFSRDTARLTALGLVYRMHLAGISLPGWRLYGVASEEARLGAEYTRWLKDGEHLKQAVADEHRRRCRALLALGWSPATAEQVSAYVRRGNPGHRLYPARLDPFICPWEALEDGELLRSVRDIVRRRFPEKSVPDPRRDEEASVRDTEAMLGE